MNSPNRQPSTTGARRRNRGLRCRHTTRLRDAFVISFANFQLTFTCVMFAWLFYASTTLLVWMLWLRAAAERARSWRWNHFASPTATDFLRA